MVKKGLNVTDVLNPKVFTPQQRPWFWVDYTLVTAKQLNKQRT